MTAVDPSLVEAISVVGVDWLDADSFVDATLTTEATDDDTTTEINAAAASKIGKGGAPHGDVLRVQFSSGFDDIASGDTITIELGGLHNVSDIAMLAYTTTTAVTATDKVVQTSVSGTTTWTFTSAFITALNDLGSGVFACRFAEDLGLSGDWKLAEVDADLTAVSDVLQAQVWM